VLRLQGEPLRHGGRCAVGWGEAHAAGALLWRDMPRRFLM
jgi:hypothetical protein